MSSACYWFHQFTNCYITKPICRIKFFPEPFSEFLYICMQGRFLSIFQHSVCCTSVDQEACSKIDIWECLLLHKSAKPSCQMLKAFSIYKWVLKCFDATLKRQRISSIEYKINKMYSFRTWRRLLLNLWALNFIKLLSKLTWDICHPEELTFYGCGVYFLPGC